VISLPLHTPCQLSLLPHPDAAAAVPLQATHAAAAAVRREELAQCSLWSTSRRASPLERAYAAAILSAEGGGGGGCGGDEHGGHSSGGVGMLELQAFRAARQNHMEASKQQFLQQELQKAAAPPGGLGPHTRGAAAAGGQQHQQQQQVGFSSGVSAAAAAAAMVCLQEPPIPVMQLRVSGVLPLGVSDRPPGADTTTSSSSSSRSLLGVGHNVAVVKVWRPCQAVQGLDEGVVVLASGLSAGSEGRSSTVDGKGRLLELSTSKMTR
jgi:hypothetical protein